MKTLRLSLLTSFLFTCVAFAQANLDKFVDGPVIKGFGKHAPVANPSVNNQTKLKVAFDVAQPAEGGKVNRKFDSLARFINMNAAAGVDPKNIELALVVHGKASFDLLDDDTYQKVYGADNPNKALLKSLLKNNVQVVLCGQTASAYEINQSQLVDGVGLELSAMTAHALLQQQGYTLNPF